MIFDILKRTAATAMGGGPWYAQAIHTGNGLRIVYGLHEDGIMREYGRKEVATPHEGYRKCHACRALVKASMFAKAEKLSEWTGPVYLAGDSLAVGWARLSS